MATTLDQRIAELLAWELRIGYSPRELLVDYVGDALAEEDVLDALALEDACDLDNARALDAWLDDQIEDQLDAALAERQAAELSWSTATDHDRLVRAMCALDENGIVAREDYGATIKAAESRVWSEAERVASLGKLVRGTCTFNRQDAEAAASGGILHLSFSAFPDSHDRAAVAIGREVAAAFRHHALTVDWDETASHRIAVRVPDWRVRRYTADLSRPTLAGWNQLWSAHRTH